jgi:UDPglucose 6-dehydrogenase
LHAITAHLPESGTVAVLGLSYKPQTEVIENSQGLELAAQLAHKGIRVVVYDPLAMNNARRALEGKVLFADNAKTCLRTADVVVITTPWPEFQQISPRDLRESNGKTTIFDCWRILQQDEFAPVADYHSVGVGPESNYEHTLRSEQSAVIAKGA